MTFRPGTLAVWLDEFVLLQNRRNTPLAALEMLLGLGVLDPPNSHAEITHRREIAQTEQSG